jgi:hypothetical protein
MAEEVEVIYIFKSRRGGKSKSRRGSYSKRRRSSKIYCFKL